MGILGALFGGSKSKATSENKAYPFIKDTLGGAVGTGAGAINQLGGELSGGFDNYLNNSGFDFAASEGLKGLTGSAAAGGLLRSGSATKGMASFLEGLRAQRYENFLNQLGNVGQLGLGAGGVVTGAGATSTSTGKSNGGIINGLAGLFG